MKLSYRNKICIFLFLVTLCLSVAGYFLLPDTVIAGYSYVDGVRTDTYESTLKLLIVAAFFPIIGGIVWELLGRKTDRKIAENPQLQSYVIRKRFINFVGFVYCAAGIFGNISIILLNL